MSEKIEKQLCMALNYFQDFIFVFAASGCVSISTFGSLVGVSVSTARCAVGLKICAITARIKKYQSIIKKKKSIKKIVLLVKMFWFLKP